VWVGARLQAYGRVSAVGRAGPDDAVAVTGGRGVRRLGGRLAPLPALKKPDTLSLVMMKLAECCRHSTASSGPPLPLLTALVFCDGLDVEDARAQLAPLVRCLSAERQRVTSGRVDVDLGRQGPLGCFKADCHPGNRFVGAFRHSIWPRFPADFFRLQVRNRF
jgi:hypothetical protein